MFYLGRACRIWAAPRERFGRSALTAGAGYAIPLRNRSTRSLSNTTIHLRQPWILCASSKITRSTCFFYWECRWEKFCFSQERRREVLIYNSRANFSGWLYSHLFYCISMLNFRRLHNCSRNLQTIRVSFSWSCLCSLFRGRPVFWPILLSFHFLITIVKIILYSEKVKSPIYKYLKIHDTTVSY